MWEGYKDDQYSFGTLTLHPNGNAALTWWYEKDAGKAQETYEGTWKQQGKDSDQLALDMNLVGGERYKSGSTVRISVSSSRSLAKRSAWRGFIPPLPHR